MKSLFNYEVPTPQYKRPLTARDRSEKLADRVKKKTPAPFNAAEFDISSFPLSEVKSAFVGQNVYVKPSYLVSMPEYCYFNRETGELMDRNPRTLTEAFLENQKNLLDNQAAGELSRKAVQGLRNSINWLCLAAKKKRVFIKKDNKNFFFKVNFITLTLPDTEVPIRSNDLQKKLLNPWLTYMRSYMGLRNYVWRLEFQANGKLHVHITTDTFLHHEKIKDTWNRLLEKSGYLKLFYKKHGHLDPNSTDVHATKKVKNMAAYLAKYMSKKGGGYKLSEKKGVVKSLGVMYPKRWYFQRLNFWNSPLNPRKISGRIWGCSTELSKANKLSVHVPAGECGQELQCLMRNDIQYRELFAPAPKNTNKPSVYAIPGIVDPPKKIGEVYFLHASDWVSKITGVIREAFDKTKWLLSKAAEHTPVFELT